MRKLEKTIIKTDNEGQQFIKTFANEIASKEIRSILIIDGKVIKFETDNTEAMNWGTSKGLA